ncbi:Endonuclease/exonuclease/phosphatase [Trinorchestia longiramus]|nr:Endonuclease/exonuclease/phosphatase [Trinorchestia longiramus]
MTPSGPTGALAERIFKGKDKIKTSMFKVIFDSNSLPPYVRIGYQQYRVNTYIGKPWQCYKCQRFAHSAAFCRSAPRCVVCSGPHTSNECNKTTGRTCCNCGGNHTANYGGCPEIKQAKEVEKTRQIQKLSYRDAVKQVLKQTATPTSQPQSVPPTNTTLSRQQPDSGNLQIPKTKTVGTQTIDELQTPAQKHVTINQLLDLLIWIFTAANAHAGGGVAILVRSDVTYTELQLTKFFPSCLEVLGINIYLQNGTPLSVLCAYNPNKIVTTRELMHYSNQLQPACIVVGDFNAHHPMWKPTKPANTTGRNIAQMLLDDPSISLITPPSLPTYYNVYQNSFSTLDLTFVSANFQPTVAVTTEEDMGSDHYPVVTSIGVAPSTAGFRKRSTWKFGSGTWENWTAALQQPELQGMDDLQREFTNFTSNLIEASHKVFKKQKNTPSLSIISLGRTQYVLEQ